MRDIYGIEFDKFVAVSAAQGLHESPYQNSPAYLAQALTGDRVKSKPSFELRGRIRGDSEFCGSPRCMQSWKGTKIALIPARPVHRNPPARSARDTSAAVGLARACIGYVYTHNT